MALLQLRFEYDSSTIRLRGVGLRDARFEYDTTSYNILRGAYEVMRIRAKMNMSILLRLLYGVVANQRVGGGASAMT